MKFLLRTLLVLAREGVSCDSRDGGKIVEDKALTTQEAIDIWRSVFPLDDDGRKQIIVKQGSLQNLFLQLWDLVSIPRPGSSAGTGEGHCAASLAA